jgi:hypothetical protein
VNDLGGGGGAGKPGFSSVFEFLEKNQNLKKKDTYQMLISGIQSI